MTVSYSWPSDFTTGVPPEDAIPAVGYVYRLVRNNPPNESDFLNTREQYPERHFESPEDEIMSYGVSVFTKLKSLKKLQADFPEPEQFGGTLIAGGDMIAELGVTQPKAKKNGHLTLWKQASSQPHLHICNCENEVS